MGNLPRKYVYKGRNKPKGERDVFQTAMGKNHYEREKHASESRAETEMSQKLPDFIGFGVSPDMFLILLDPVFPLRP